MIFQRLIKCLMLSKRSLLHFSVTGILVKRNAEDLLHWKETDNLTSTYKHNTSTASLCFNNKCSFDTALETTKTNELSASLWPGFKNSPQQLDCVSLLSVFKCHFVICLSIFALCFSGHLWSRPSALNIVTILYTDLSTMRGTLC